MNIQIQRKCGNYSYITSVTDVIKDKVASTDYDIRGVAEKAQEMTQNAGELLGRLITILVEKKVLDEANIQTILNNYDIEQITILPPQDV